MSNLGPIQTNGATELTAEEILAALTSGLPVFTDRINQYSEALVPFNTETTVLSYLVPVGQTFYILGMKGWGDTNGEFFIKIDGTIVGGNRTTAALPACDSEFAVAPIKANTGSLITITAIIYTMTTHTMRANLLGGVIQ